MAQSVTLTRFRAKIVYADDDQTVLGGLFPTRDRAIKEAIDYILTNGIVVVEEVPVRKRTKTEWEEITDAR